MRRLKKRRTNRRYGAIESLEYRRLLTWQNIDDPYNVDDDPQQVVGFNDAVLVVGELQNRRISDPATGKILNDARPEGEPFYDVDGDGFVSPIDAIRVLNNFRGPVDCFFDGTDPQWITRQSGGSQTPGSVTSENCAAVLHEGDSLESPIKE